MVVFLTVLFAMGLLSGYMIFKAHHDIVDVRIIADPELPRAFHGFHIFFISDIHRRKLDERTLKSIKTPIDAVFIGGDIMEKGVPLKQVGDNIQKLKRWGAPLYFVWGNNDYETDEGKLLDLLEHHNVIVLANSCHHMRRKDQMISIIGLDCNKYRESRLDLAERGVKGSYRILLAHDPSAFYEQEAKLRDRINIVFSGHTHGGQIRIFGLGLYKRGGLTKLHNTNILVSEGYGYTALPFRLGTKAECHVITLKKAAK